MLLLIQELTDLVAGRGERERARARQERERERGGMKMDYEVNWICSLVRRYDFIMS